MATATKPIRMGDITIWSDEVVPVAPVWIASYLYPDGRSEVDVAHTDTPGQALDAAIKWAKDRGLEVFVEGQKFSVIRPGKVV